MRLEGDVSREGIWPSGFLSTPGLDLKLVVFLFVGWRPTESSFSSFAEFIFLPPLRFLCILTGEEEDEEDEEEEEEEGEEYDDDDDDDDERDPEYDEEDPEEEEDGDDDEDEDVVDEDE